MARKTVTSTEVKQRWEKKAYIRYMVRLRHDTDQDLIDWIDERKDTIGTSAIFRDGARLLMQEEMKKK